MRSRLFIESIGSEENLRRGATAEELLAVASISKESRRCEVLAWRAIVRRELGEGIRISYDEYGAPQVDMPNTYISISHSKGEVAVLISDSPCAVDIEHFNRDFRRVADRYLSDAERSIAEQYDIFAEMWSAKESLYKYHRKGGLDLVRDIVIKSYSISNYSFIASLCGGEDVVVELRREGNLVVALIG